ncbi:MAG: hypothetical protein AAB320_10995 [Elusimicrobiota bacterium]
MNVLLPVILGALGAAAAEPPLPPAPAGEKIEFVADHVDYARETTTLHLKGAVRIQESTWTIKAEELYLNTETRRGRSEGDLLVEDKMSALYGDYGEFDFRRHEGILYHASAGHGEWRMHAKSLSLASDRRLDYRSADFTSCSFDPKPHYHFRASRVTVVPRKHLLARNVVFFMGKVPVFYMPFLYKSLKSTHFLRFKVQPGYDRRNGGFLRSTLVTDYTPYTYSKLFIDYYSSQGLGLGGELHRRKGIDSRGVLYGYHIREQTNGQRRWAVLGDGYQGFAGSFSAQGRLQVQSDADFNNHYARASLFRITPELINNGALVHRSPQVTTRLSYAREDTADASRTRFLKQAESYPRLDVQSTPLKWGRLPWLNTLTGFADNTYAVGRPFIQKSVGGAWQGTRTFPVVQGVSFTPKLTYGQTYLNRVDQPADFRSTSTVLSAVVGRYTAEGNLRFATRAGDWDLAHAFTRRQRAGSMSDDSGAPDHGIETNLISLADAYRPHRRVLLRLVSGYDVRYFRDRSLGFRERVRPIEGELTYNPRSTLNFSVRDAYQLQEGNQSFIFDGAWGERTADYFSAGSSYNLSQPGQWFASTEFGVSASSASLQFGAALRAEVNTPGGFARANRFRLFEKEFFLTKHWHDFFGRLSARFRPGGVKEVAIRLDIKLGSFSKEKARARDWESEWFPERKAGFEERQ